PREPVPSPGRLAPLAAHPLPQGERVKTAPRRPALTRRRVVAVAALLALLPAGCFNSHNPGYFPYYLPGGPISQEHAKPRFGYFRDFDPKACRLDVTPRDATAPLGSQIVLVATVSDKDGQPRRSRRVEWLLEGPGNIIEVDESGVYAGRGYKVDNKYAVTYTRYAGATITRGNDDPKDDVEICAGQTFCVVTGTVPGETTITAYAPGVFNWERGRVISKIVWGEGRFSFPASAVVRAGGEHTLTTTVTRFEQDGPAAPQYRVRYTLLDEAGAAPAVLVGRAGVSQSGTAAKDAEAPVDADGAAAVRLVQPAARPGKSRVLVEVVKPPETGTGPGKVVGRREAVVEWAAPGLAVDVAAPPVAGPAGAFPVTVNVNNTGAVEGGRVGVRVSLSDGAKLESADPPPARRDGNALVFELPPAAAGAKQVVTLKVLPARLGAVTVTAEASAADLQARKEATTRIEAGKLGLVVEAPPNAATGTRVPVRLAVTNSGPTPAANTTVWALFDGAFKSADGKDRAEFAAGTLAPGQTKTFDLPLTATTAGRYAVRGTATADGNLTAPETRASVEVRRAELTAKVGGPKVADLGQPFAWAVTVANAGEVAVGNVVVRALLPSEVRLKDAGGGAAGTGSVEWRLDSLKPGERRTLNLTLEGAKLAERTTMSVSVLADPAGGGDPIEARAEGVVAVTGTPAVVLELATPPGLLEVGKRAAFQVRVRNTGTVPARDVAVTAFAPAELKVVRAADAAIDATGKAAFPSVGELRPGEVRTFTVEVEAVAAGDARFRAEVRAAHLSAALKEEQAARVVGR
ncbi:MAG: DUF11 domain-containing protein, partial [Gemmataceae bacterium]|nr:DUF11 domain-containing protein [Gemmataceae bacterium]